MPKSWLSKTVMCDWLKSWRQWPQRKNVVYLLVRKRFIGMLLSDVHLYLLFHSSVTKQWCFIGANAQQRHPSECHIQVNWLLHKCVRDYLIQHFHDYVYWPLSCWLQSKSSSVSFLMNVPPLAQVTNLGIFFPSPTQNQTKFLILSSLKSILETMLTERVNKGDGVERAYIEAQDGDIKALLVCVFFLVK